MTNAERIYNRLIAAGMTAAGAAGTLGNLEAESALRANNLQDPYNSSLGLSDEGYTAAVDSGRYGRFQNDCAGYGLAQWTFWTRKRDLLAFAKERGVSVGDPDMQADFVAYEIKRDYAALWNTLTTTSDVTTASYGVLTVYERPADMSAGVQSYRAGLSRKWFDQLANTATQPEPPQGAPEPPQDTAAICTVTLPQLAKGSAGEAVSTAQELLWIHGFSCGTDGRGNFGTFTQNAVVKYQITHDLEDDGIIGSETWTSLLTKQ